MKVKKPTKPVSGPSLKAIASGYYDLQKLRIMTGNRLVANFKLRLGQEVSKPEQELDAEGKEILMRVRKAYKLIADAAAELPRVGKFEGNETIADYAELTLAHHYESLIREEEESAKLINQIVHQHPLWKEYMVDVKGLGELMALVILSSIDIRKARHASSLWKYCGLDVAPDGNGRSKRKEHLVEWEFKNKDGEADIREGISYNPFIRTKLIGVLGPSFIKAGIRSDKEDKTKPSWSITKYGQIYLDYKHRLESNPKFADGCERPAWVGPGKKFSAKLWRHNKAVRYMVKMFLIDLYVACRTLEGLEVSKPYHEAKLHLTHGGADQGKTENATAA
jgi:hypothetical protein